ncbi:MAG: TIM44-like domain-containing protein [Hyphomicrobiaceae bacterium]
MSRITSWVRTFGLTAIGLFAAMAFVITEAEARAGRGFSSGSRGSRTFQAPPSTNTAPRTTAPIQRSITQPGRPSAATTPTAGSAVKQPSRFGGALKGLLLGGLFGAALAGIFGAGALANIVGFLLQMLVIGGIIYMVMAFFRGRAANKPAMAAASASGAQQADVDQNAYRAASADVGANVAPGVQQADYDAFERLLTDVQLAYGNNDLAALETRVTPEMLSYFAQELDENARQGVRNELSDVRLLQGDLAETWQEGRAEYATVAMRYALRDVTVEAASGRVVAGSRTRPQEVTEVWTFVRPVGGTADQWELSAIQQTE